MSERYLLDTNICIALIKRTSTRAMEKIQRLRPGDICVSSITVAELSFGAEKSQFPERNRSAIRKFMTPLVIVDFDSKSAAHYGVLRALLEGAGTPIGPLDTLIAAQALAYELIVVTNNEREFSRVKGLRKMENWL